MNHKSGLPHLITSETGSGQYKLTLHFDSLKAMQDYYGSINISPTSSAQPASAGHASRIRDDDMVLVERGILAAACHALRNWGQAPRLLERMRAASRSNGQAKDPVQVSRETLKQIAEAIEAQEALWSRTRESGCLPVEILGTRAAIVAVRSLLAGGE